MTRHYNRHLSVIELTAGQFGVLVAIEAAPKSTIATLAHLIGMDATTMTRALPPLESRGLIQRSGGRGRDGTTLDLTPKGMKLFRKGLNEWSEAYGLLVDRLGGEEQAKNVLQAMRSLEMAGS